MQFWRRNSLSLTFGLLFLLSLAGQIVAGSRAYNSELNEHGRASTTLSAYLQSGHFLEATFENWESEFLQMALFVVLTVSLRQKGSSESKKLDESEEVDEDPRARRYDPRAPWPVRRGGILLRLYERSLSLAFFVLFAISFLLHGLGGVRALNLERKLHGQPDVKLTEYMGTSEFWFESFQNWQSELLAVFAIVLLSIVLRERGSPQSKPVAAPHEATGAI